MQVEPGTKGLSAIIQIKQQQPSTEQEHLIAMGRCRISLYDPEGILVDETEYLGASSVSYTHLAVYKRQDFL